MFFRTLGIQYIFIFAGTRTASLITQAHKKKWSVLEYWPYISLVFSAAKHESNLHFVPARQDFFLTQKTVRS